MVFIRDATLGDCPEILTMLNELQFYEQFPCSKITLDMLEKNGAFRDSNSSTSGERHFRAIIAQDETSGDTCGYSLYYYAWSSSKGKLLFLEELYVRDRYRGQKIGAALMCEILKTATNDLVDVHLEVLNWNQNSIQFYEKFGFKLLYKSRNDTWLTYCKKYPSIII